MIFALLFFLSLPIVPQIRGHIAPPLPTTVGGFAFLSQEYFSSFFPGRIPSNCVPTHATRSQQLILSF